VPRPTKTPRFQSRCRSLPGCAPQPRRRAAIRRRRGLDPTPTWLLLARTPPPRPIRVIRNLRIGIWCLCAATPHPALPTRGRGKKGRRILEILGGVVRRRNQRERSRRLPKP
jgi:hypothetical protein